MSLININQAYLDELKVEITDAEKRQARLNDYIEGLQALYKGMKTFLEKKSGLTDINADALSETEKFLDKVELNLDKATSSAILSTSPVFSTNGASSGGKFLADVPANQFEESLGNTPNLPDIVATDQGSDAAENRLSSSGMLKGLSMFEALKKYLSMFSEKQTVRTIMNGLTDYGFEADSKHFYEGVRGMLRYHEAKNIFERDGTLWGLVREEMTEVPTKSRSDKPIESQIVTSSKSAANIKVPTEKGTPENKPPRSVVKTNTLYCKEILQKSGQPWLHVDQILVYLKNDYDIIRSKKIISSALRKNAKNKQPLFKAIGRNRFGLLEARPAVKEDVSA